VSGLEWPRLFCSAAFPKERETASLLLLVKRFCETLGLSAGKLTFPEFRDFCRNNAKNQKNTRHGGAHANSGAKTPCG
jgi:hypothetical protein